MKRWRTAVVLVVTAVMLIAGAFFVWQRNRVPEWPEITDDLALYWLGKANVPISTVAGGKRGDHIRDPYLSVLCMAGDFNRAENRILQFPSERRDDAWHTAAFGFYNAGHYEQAAEATRRIEREFWRSRAAERLTGGRYTGAWYQDLPDAMKAHRVASGKDLHSAKLRETAISAALVGDFEHARERLAEIKDDGDRKMVTDALAFWQGAYKKGRDFARAHKRFSQQKVEFYFLSLASLGRLPQAEKAVEILSHPLRRGVGYVYIAGDVAKTERRADALRLLHRAEEEARRFSSTTAPSNQNRNDHTLLHALIATQLVYTGYPARARAMIARVARMTGTEDTASRMAIIEASLAMDDVNGAIALATQTDGATVPDLLAQIVRHLAAKRDRERVDDLVEALESPAIRTEMFLDAAEVLIRAENDKN